LFTGGFFLGLSRKPGRNGKRNLVAEPHLADWKGLGNVAGPARNQEMVECCGQVRAVPFKKAPKALVTYLEKAEMDALLAAPDLTTAQGRRDHAVLLFLYNSGTRADEVAHVLIGDLHLGLKPGCDPSAVLIRGKGNKLRRCPLWARTVSELTALVDGRTEKEYVFLNRRGEPLTRFGIHTMVERYAAMVAEKMPSVATKTVSPHTIRHTTATHLLASRGGHQHHSRVAGARIIGYDERLRGD
jgi:integrase/recombinase XerD